MPDDHSTAAGFRWGIELTPDVPIVRVAELAARAEAAGFGGALVSNHYNNRDPFLALDRAATVTTDIRLGPGVLNPYEAHPLRLATAMGTLNEAADGRGIFGIGAGDGATLTALGYSHDRPVTRVAETIDVTRSLLAGESVAHHGTFTAADARLSYETDPVPVLVGGQGPQMTRMAATEADGLLANASHPADFDEISNHVESGLAARDPDRGPFTFAGFVSVSVAETAAEARAAARPPVAFITAGAPDRVIERHDLDGSAVDAIEAALAAGDRETAYDRVTPGMIDAFCAAGTPATVRDRLRRIGQDVDAIVAGSPLGPDRETAIGLLAEICRDLRTAGVLEK